MAKINSYNEGQPPAYQIKLVYIIMLYIVYIPNMVFSCYISLLLSKDMQIFFMYFICGGLNSWMHRWITKVSSECTCA